MSTITMQNAQRLVTLFSGAMKGMIFYPDGHPAVKKPLQEIMSVVVESLWLQPELKLGLVDGVFFVEDHLFFAPTTSIEELAGRLEEKGIVVVKIRQGVTLSELNLFLSLLGKNTFDVLQMHEAMAEQGIVNISISAMAEDDAGDAVSDGPEHGANKTYNEALNAIRGVFDDIERGRVPSSGKLLTVVRDMAILTIQDPLTLVGLAMIKDYDNYTFTHSVNVGIISMGLAAYLNLGMEEIEVVGMAGFLHDIGKTQINKGILNKPGKLTASEFEEMKKHTESGTQIIKEMTGINPKVAQAVLGHHIGFNRQGYPEWARGQDFDSTSEIVAAADCYDAITTIRSYRRPLNPKEALAEIQGLSGNYLNGKIVESFHDMMGKYPVGTLVRLDNNEIAVVYRPNLANREAPMIKVVLDAAGRKPENTPVKCLVDEAGNYYANIVAVVDPILKNIDVAGYLN